MIKNKKRKIFLLFCLLFFSAIAGSAFALEIAYPKVPGVQSPQEFLQIAPPEEHLSLYVLYIFNLAIWLSGLVALGVLTWAGILYLTSAGKPEKVASARNIITGAFLGILLLLSAFIILQILNPQLILLEIPELAPVKLIDRPEIPPPPEELHRSAVSTETPFANIIEERILEEQRMTRISENASTTLDIANELAEINKEIRGETDICRCYENTVPDPPPQCPDCQSERCTCDTCEPQRASIEHLQQEELLPKLEELKAEQLKTVEEVRLLKEELGKLERAETFMLQCQLTSLESLAELLGTKEYYLNNKWLFLDIKFWDQISTIEDWANFYCPVSGTIWGGVQYTPQEEISPVELPEEVISEPMACLTEVPIGDIIDRTKRTVKLLIEKLEKLIDLQGQMIEVVDRMVVLTSQYSSDHCFPVTFPIYVHGECVGCVEVGCFGLAGPYWEVQCQVKTIEAIRRRIERLVMGGPEEVLEGMPFCGDVRDLPLELQREFYNSCTNEYSTVKDVIREGWIIYAENNTTCIFYEFGSICEWKGTASGLRDFVDSYTKARVDQDTLENFSGYWCKLPDKKLDLARINEYINCVQGGPQESIGACYNQLEGRYDPVDSLPCIGTCVENKIKKALRRYNPEPVTEPEELGIIPLIERKVPPILEDLEKTIRLTMRACITEIDPDKPEESPAVLLSSCDSSLGAIGPKGISIESCCLQEPEFQECLQECYLEEGQERYKECLRGCLREKSEELEENGKTKESEIIAACRHRINFYCCGK